MPISSGPQWKLENGEVGHDKAMPLRFFCILATRLTKYKHPVSTPQMRRTFSNFHRPRGGNWGLEDVLALRGLDNLFSTPKHAGFFRFPPAGGGGGWKLEIGKFPSLARLGKFVFHTQTSF